MFWVVFRNRIAGMARKKVAVLVEPKVGVESHKLDETGSIPVSATTILTAEAAAGKTIFLKTEEEYDALKSRLREVLKQYRNDMREAYKMHASEYCGRRAEEIQKELESL